MDKLSEYLDYLESSRALSTNSLRLYRRDLLDFYAFVHNRYGEEFQIADLKANHLELFRSQILKAGASTASINRKLSALHGYWIWLRSEQKVSRDPFTQIIRGSQYRNKSAKYLSQEQINSLLDHPEHDLRSKMILELFYGTGIRVGELTRLTITDIDLENQLLTIPRSSRFKERLIPFNKLLKSYLEEYIKQNSLKAEDTLLRNKNQNKLSEREVFAILRKAGSKLDIQELSPSLMRNSFIQHLKERGAYDRLLCDLTGQKNI